MSTIGNLSERYSNSPVAKALFQLLPAGGAADSLLQHRAEELRTERLRVFFDELASGEQELSEGLLESNDFLHAYFSTLNAVIRTKRKEKIRLFGKLLKSSVDPQRMSGDSDEFDEFVSILDMLSIREFVALVELSRLEGVTQRAPKDNDLQFVWRYWPQFQSFMIDNLGILNDDLPSFMVKIERTGLYVRITGGFMDYEGDMGTTTNLFRRLLVLVNNE